MGPTLGRASSYLAFRADGKRLDTNIPLRRGGLVYLIYVRDGQAVMKTLKVKSSERVSVVRPAVQSWRRHKEETDKITSAVLDYWAALPPVSVACSSCIVPFSRPCTNMNTERDKTLSRRSYLFQDKSGWISMPMPMSMPMTGPRDRKTFAHESHRCA